MLIMISTIYDVNVPDGNREAEAPDLALKMNLIALLTFLREAPDYLAPKMSLIALLALLSVPEAIPQTLK